MRMLLWIRPCLTHELLPNHKVPKMKSTIKLVALALAVSLASCGDNESSTTTTETNADTKSTMSPQGPGPDTMSAGGAMANTGMSDQDFVTQASSMNIAEVNAHKAAQTHATTADVKAHAKHMLTDHQKMGDEMKTLATSKGLTLATEPPAEKKQMLDDMNANKKGKDWDAAYVDGQIRDHEEAIALFERGSGSVKDADLKTLIDKTLPTLRSHLEMVRDAQAKMPK
jgi:putative membrane protein